MFVTGDWNIIDELSVDGVDWWPYIDRIQGYSYFDAKSYAWLAERIEVRVNPNWARVLFDTEVDVRVAGMGDGMAIGEWVKNKKYMMTVNGTEVTFTSRPEAQK